MNISRNTLILMFLIFLSGCSNKSDNAVILDASGKHPAGWVVANTGGNHPAAYLANQNACVECHGSAIDKIASGNGGISGVSCFSSSRSGITCHPNGPPAHPSDAAWKLPSGHGSRALAEPILGGNTGFAVCQRCHGSDFSGGTSGKSCFICHGVNAPHPNHADWTLKSGTLSHVKVGESNASVCSQCHNATQNNLTQPYQARFTPAGSFLAGTAGCFNGTLCHAGITNTSNCTVCHGPLSSTTFNSLAGVTAATDAKAGAHIKHLHAVLGSPVACSECHSVPVSPAVSGTHRDGTVQVSFGTLAKTGSLVSTVSRDAASGALVCSNTYCHGVSLSGGSNKTPRWNDTAYNVGCTTCHGYPPTTIRGGATHSTSTSCSGCHSHVNATNNGFTPTGVALHINGSVEASGGSAHSVPNYNHQAGGTGSACTGCHTVGTATSVYPAATLGNAPDCRGCHVKAAPGVGCGSCHGGTDGRPTGTSFPDKRGQHSRGEHNVACTVCHVLGASAGTGATINHGPGNRGTNPNVVGPGFTTGIILSGGTKGTSPAASCNHNATMGGGCGSSEGGTKSW